MFKKFYNLSECELNTKKQRRSLCQNDVMATVIKLCRAKEKQVKEKQMGSEKVKYSKILRFHNVENMKSNQKQETYPVKVYKIDPYFREHYRKKNTH